jgi:hypothetical protein
MMRTRTPVLPSAAPPAPQVVDLSGDDDLSPRGRRIAWAITLVLLLGGLAVLSAAATTQLTGAAPGSRATGTTSGEGAAGRAADAARVGSGPGEALDGAIQASWDGPTTHLDWRGRTYATAEASFVGDRVASPGDRVQRTLRIGNAGPADAVMVVSLVLDRTAPTQVGAGDLSEALDLFWDVAGVEGQERFATLLASDRERPVVSEVVVPRGETVPVTVGFSMPAEVAGYADAASDGVAEFQVVVSLQGDTAAPEVPALAITGSHLLGIAALALGLAGLGWLLTLARHRRLRCDGCGTRLRRGDRWTEQHDEDGTRLVRCERCQGLGIADVARPAEAAAGRR